MKKAFDCEGNEVKVGDYIHGAMSELWFILRGENKVIDIKFDNNNEAYVQVEGKEGYWDLGQCLKI